MKGRGPHRGASSRLCARVRHGQASGGGTDHSASVSQDVRPPAAGLGAGRTAVRGLGRLNTVPHAGPPAPRHYGSRPKGERARARGRASLQSRGGRAQGAGTLDPPRRGHRGAARLRGGRNPVAHWTKSRQRRDSGRSLRGGRRPPLRCSSARGRLGPRGVVRVLVFGLLPPIKYPASKISLSLPIS